MSFWVMSYFARSHDPMDYKAITDKHQWMHFYCDFTALHSCIITLSMIFFPFASTDGAVIHADVYIKRALLTAICSTLTQRAADILKPVLQGMQMLRQGKPIPYIRPKLA